MARSNSGANGANVDPKTTAPKAGRAPKAPKNAPDAGKPGDEKAPVTETWSRMADAPKADHEIHKLLAQSGQYGRFTCAPKVGGLLATEIDRTKFEFCAYCLDNAERPVDAPKPKALKTPKAPKAPVAPKVEAVAKFAQPIADLAGKAQALIAQIVAASSGIDAAALHAELVKAAADLRPSVPKRSRSTSGTPGVRQARGAYGAEVKVAGDTPEIAEIRLYAEAGDRRAQEIIAHIDAYVEGADCSYCAAKGRSAQHRRTGFMSAGREIEAMRARKLAADNAPAPSQPAAEGKAGRKGKAKSEAPAPAAAPKAGRKGKAEAQTPAPAADAPKAPKAPKPSRTGRPRTEPQVAADSAAVQGQTTPNVPASQEGEVPGK